MREKNIIVKGINLRFYQSDDFDGKRRPLVFLHGWGVSALSLQDIFVYCRNWLALDFPGFGGSELPPRSWSLADYANLLEDFLVKMKVTHPVLIGHSFGGRVVIKYCAEPRKAMPRQIVLIASAGLRSRSLRLCCSKIAAKVLKLPFLLPGLRRWKNKARQAFYRYLHSADYLAAGPLSEIFRRVVGEDLRYALPKIKIPALLIWGNQDKETPLSAGKEMSRLLPQAKLKLIKGANHFPFQGPRKDEFKEIFLKFVPC
jgi:pimeloyl-ACP methyl ester carboxylesterase